MIFEDKNIWAKVICDSIAEGSINRMTTFEIQFPRFILAELNTHGMLKKNTQSSRAVPIKAMLDLYKDEFYIPVRFGKNQAGMSSREYLSEVEDMVAGGYWIQAEASIRELVEVLSDKEGLNVHKQWAARLYEPFMYIKLVITATEWDNFFWLRDDEDAAQPEMVDLARKMKAARDESTPKILYPGQWHMPYVYSYEFGDNANCQTFYDTNGVDIDVDTALMISASCAAQMSYRKADESIEKAHTVYDRLFNGSRPHYSPCEHQGRVMQGQEANLVQRVFPSLLEVGVSHMDRTTQLWSGNLKGFVQYRKLLEQNN